MEKTVREVRRITHELDESDLEAAVLLWLEEAHSIYTNGCDSVTVTFAYGESVRATVERENSWKVKDA